MSWFCFHYLQSNIRTGTTNVPNFETDRLSHLYVAPSEDQNSRWCSFIQLSIYKSGARTHYFWLFCFLIMNTRVQVAEKVSHMIGQELGIGIICSTISLNNIRVFLTHFTDSLSHKIITPVSLLFVKITGPKRFCSLMPRKPTINKQSIFSLFQMCLYLAFRISHIHLVSTMANISWHWATPFSCPNSLSVLFKWFDSPKPICSQAKIS
jgi:hypothetical protein